MNSKEGEVQFAVVPVIGEDRPSFQSAARRLVHAGERLAEIQKAAPAVAEEWNGYTSVRVPLDDLGAYEVGLVDWSWEHTAASWRLTHLASEVLHHVRIALDYCAFHLVWMDGGSTRKNTKFPLVLEESKYGKEKRSSLPGITELHSTFIRSVQPFNNVEWSKHLVELSNRDKHYFAAQVIPIYRYEIDRSRIWSDPKGDPDYGGYAVENARLDLTIAPAMTSTDRLGESLPLVDTLVGICEGSIEVVNSFLREEGYGPIKISFEK